MVSSHRRRDPAGVRLTSPGQASNSCSDTAAQVSAAMPNGVRSERIRWAWICLSMFSADFFPMRGSCARRPSSAACSNSATDEMFSSSTAALTVLGPMPGTSSSSRTFGGSSSASRS